ncbi:MAG: RNA polymerase sigma factor [Ktedonobacteraceae bacterium]
MSIKRIAVSAAWLALLRQDKRGEALTADPWVRFEALYQCYYPGILAFLRFLVGSPEVAEDLTSLVFEKALLHLADLRTPGTAGPWLFRIAHNCAMDYFRRCKPTISLEQLLPTEHPPAASIEEEAMQREQQRHLLAHLSLLSEREREVIGLKFAANLNNREIARVLQIPEGTVSSLLYRALRRLRAAFHEEGGQNEG